MKYLFLLVLLWLAWRGWRQMKRLAARPSAVVTEEWVVACAHCGVHAPRRETIDDDAGRHYCSEAHRRLGPRS
ncbi:MAG: hypothetical protein LBO79_08585 [Zoogloeaceae bacterium]|jgi:uncharacterized protein|nr:hypothetical protein [Zoogloeaceae bacterium]